MKGLFLDKLGVTFDSKETVLNLNGCNIEAYPSNHLDAARSLTNPKFILVDEGDFLPKFQQEDVRHVVERYIARSDPYICLVSTPNAPGGLFDKIEKEPFDTCIYKKVFLDYMYGVGKIYTQEEIDKAHASPSFEREYCLKYQGLIGLGIRKDLMCKSFLSISNGKKKMGWLLQEVGNDKPLHFSFHSL